jgi:hypothetical protein
MRSAWKVSFAGCIAWYSLPFALRTNSANGCVVFGSVPVPPTPPQFRVS